MENITVILKDYLVWLVALYVISRIIEDTKKAFKVWFPKKEGASDGKEGTR